MADAAGFFHETKAASELLPWGLRLEEFLQLRDLTIIVLFSPCSSVSRFDTVLSPCFKRD